MTLKLIGQLLRLTPGDASATNPALRQDAWTEAKKFRYFAYSQSQAVFVAGDRSFDSFRIRVYYRPLEINVTIGDRVRLNGIDYNITLLEPIFEKSNIHYFDVQAVGNG